MKSRQVMGDLPKALEYFEEDLRISKAALGPDHHAVAATLTNIGAAYVAQGDKARAKEALTQAKQIFIRQLGKDHPNVAVVAGWLADL